MDEMIGGNGWRKWMEEEEEEEEEGQKLWMGNRGELIRASQRLTSTSTPSGLRQEGSRIGAESGGMLRVHSLFLCF